MIEAKTRTVLLASENGPERDRLKNALTKVLSKTEESIVFREVDSHQKLLAELRSLKENLVSLVVISGFDGLWHNLFWKFAALVESEVAGVLMSKSTARLIVAQWHGLRPVRFSEGEIRVAEVAAEQLAKLKPQT